MMDAGRMAPYVGFTEAEVHDLFAERKEGMLRLYHRKESIAEAAYCSYFGLRQKSYRFEAETAGLVLYQNHENHLRMEIAKSRNRKFFVL